MSSLASPSSELKFPIHQGKYLVILLGKCSDTINTLNSDISTFDRLTLVRFIYGLLNYLTVTQSLQLRVIYSDLNNTYTIFLKLNGTKTEYIFSVISLKS